MRCAHSRVATYLYNYVAIISYVQNYGQSARKDGPIIQSNQGGDVHKECAQICVNVTCLSCLDISKEYDYPYFSGA